MCNNLKIEGVDIIIVDVPFKYGPNISGDHPIYKHNNKFLQISMFRYLFWNFANKFDYIYNFDIDEYLFLNGPIESFFSNNNNIYIKGMWVSSFLENGEKGKSYKNYKYLSNDGEIIKHGKWIYKIDDFKIEPNFQVHHNKNVRTKSTDLSEAYFLHYKGITTNWKANKDIDTQRPDRKISNLF